MEAAYRQASQRLAQAWARLDQPAPDRVPLRLDGERGVLRSALARRGGGQALALAEALARGLDLEGSPFAQARAQGGMVFLVFSQEWLGQVLETVRVQPWPEPEPVAGLCRQGPENPRFLRAYTLQRCRTWARRGEPNAREPWPPELVCPLAQGPEVGWGEIARRYWRLPPALRRNPALAGAVGPAMGWGKGEP